MAYGKLAILKTYGERHTFALLDKDNNILIRIPNLDEWLHKHLGKKIDVYITDSAYQVTGESGGG